MSRMDNQMFTDISSWYVFLLLLLQVLFYFIGLLLLICSFNFRKIYLILSTTVSLTVLLSANT